MKKYITVAALLAAGTAFANADVVAVFNCGGSDATSSQWMDRNQTGWKLAQMGDGGNGSESFNVRSESGITLSLSAGAGVLSRTGSGGSFTVGTAGDNGPYEIPGTLTTLSQGVLGNGYDTLWGGAVNLWDAGSATLTLGGLKANTEYTVYLFSARANAHNSGNGGFVTWSTTDSVSASWSVITADGASSESPEATVQFDGSSTGANASIVKVSFTTGAETSVSFSTGDSQRFTLNGIVVDQGQTIPEPSAFGLLAGLGALALVASRRRRK